MKLTGRFVLLALAFVLLAAGLYLGFAPTYVSNLIPGDSPRNCGSAFLPRDVSGSGIGAREMRTPAISLVVASALCGLGSFATRRR